MPIQTLPLWEAIRQRPAMWMGEASLSMLYGFILGYDVAHSMERSPSSEPSPVARDFHDWVAYRLHFYEGTRGWKKMILQKEPNESLAFEKFWSLLDDYRARKPRLVAQLIDCKETYQRLRKNTLQKCRCPRLLSLIAYTDDPGLFLGADEAEEANKPLQDRFITRFCPSIKGFHWDPSQLTVVDPTTYQLWATDWTDESIWS